MKQYIDKDALVSEIEKHQAIWDGMDGDFCKGQRLAYSDMLSFINTLEVKEVDLEKEWDKCCENRIFDDESEVYTARRFFELGFKAKGE